MASQPSVQAAAVYSSGINTSPKNCWCATQMNTGTVDANTSPVITDFASVRAPTAYQIAMPTTAITYDGCSALWLKITVYTRMDARNERRCAASDQPPRASGSISKAVPPSCTGQFGPSYPSRSCMRRITEATRSIASADPIEYHD